MALKILLALSCILFFYPNEIKDVDKDSQGVKPVIAEVKEPVSYQKKVICTAYTASARECGKDDAITASGTHATEGRTIACDFLKFGTKVKIDGIIYYVEDRFGGNYQNKIDIYMNDVNKAWKFGKQTKVVTIYKERG